MDSASANLSFREVQRFRSPWLWVPLLAGGALLVGFFAYAVIEQIGLGRPFGNNPTSDAQLIWSAAIAVVILLATVVLLTVARLETQVCDGRLVVRFFPFHRRFHDCGLDRVRDIAAVTYHPITEYGGWGIRWTLRGKAYNVSGRRGVRLDYENGKHLLIGSGRADELAAAIHQALGA